MEQQKEHGEHKEIHPGHHKKTITHHIKKITLSKSFYKKTYVVLGIALILFALYNLIQISSLSNFFEQKIAEAKEATRAAEIQLMIISTNSCVDCYDINALVEVIESTGVNITSRKEVDFSSKEAESLIEEYNIGMVPTVIISGEINKSLSLMNTLKKIGKEKNEAYIFTKLEPPYIEAKSGRIRGKVSLIHLKKDSCKDCFDLTPLIIQLKELGIIFKQQEEIYANSNEGRDLIKEYDIKKVPTIIMDKEAEVYPNIIQGWSQIGSVEDDGSFVMRNVNPPYYSIEEGRVKGLISLMVLRDNACDRCYDAIEFHKPILQRMGVVFKEEELDVSSSEGQELVNKYEIEKIPTIILTGDIEEYPVLVGAWPEVGTVEPDGAYIFRSVEIAKQPYKNLTADKIVG